MRGDPPSAGIIQGRPASSTPHARGSTSRPLKAHLTYPVYPACAGIHPGRFAEQLPLARLPRMRGDPPLYHAMIFLARASTPHARGSTWRPSIPQKPWTVYPACAGIHLAWREDAGEAFSLPRMRGDPPVVATKYREKIQSTPHARGSTLRGPALDDAGSVYPACAGIHLRSPRSDRGLLGLPRMRGDPPSFL